MGKAYEKIKRKVRDSVPDKFGLINKNFANYPLARDPRVKFDWRKNSKYRYAQLPGDEDITFYFAISTPTNERRGPDGCDMNVLWALLRQAVMEESTELTFNSHTALLRTIGMRNTGPSRRKLEDALTLWQGIEIEHGRWYFPNSRKRGKVLRPAIVSKRQRGRRLMITLDKDWIEDCKGYTHRMPLPLPMRACEQNIALTVQVSREDFTRSANGHEVLFDRKLRRYCTKIGLFGKHLGKRLASCFLRANRYFIFYQGFLVAKIERGVVQINMTPPKQPPRRRVKLTAKPAKPTPASSPEPTPRAILVLQPQPREPEPQYSEGWATDSTGQRYKIRIYADGRVEDA